MYASRKLGQHWGMLKFPYFVATRTEHARRSRDLSARMEERMNKAQAEVTQEKEDKRDISTGMHDVKHNTINAVSLFFLKSARFYLCILV